MRVQIVGSWVERVLDTLTKLRFGRKTTEAGPQQNADIDWTRRTFQPFN